MRPLISIVLSFALAIVSACSDRAATNPNDAGPDMVRADTLSHDIGADTFTEPDTGGDPICGVELCGNQVLDECTVCEGSPNPGGWDSADAGSAPMPPPMDAGPVCYQVQEACDRTNLDEQSCESLGYVSGELACSTICTFDVSGCDSCATDPTIKSCTLPDLPTAPTLIDIAVKGDEIGVAWLKGQLNSVSRVDPKGSLRLCLSIFDSTLAPKATHCFGDEAPTSVSIAATATDWIVATGSATGITLRRLDGHSQFAGTEKLIPSGSKPRLVPRPDATPLLLYYQQGGGSPLMAALLEDALFSAWTTEVLSETYGDGYGGGVFTGDGFLVADRLSAYPDGGVRVAHLTLDGTLGAISQPGGPSTEYPSLSWHGDSARISWVDFDSPLQMFVARLNNQGQRVGAAVAVPSGGDYFNKAPTAAIGDDLLVLMGGYTGGTGYASHLAFARHDAQLTRTSGPTTLNQGPVNTTSYRLAAFGQGGVAAWVETRDPPRLGMALLEP